MARIAGVNIPTAKRVVVGLQYIHGIGQAKAKEILGKVGIDESRRVNTLNDDEVMALVESAAEQHYADLLAVPRPGA